MTFRLGNLQAKPALGLTTVGQAYLGSIPIFGPELPIPVDGLRGWFDETSLVSPTLWQNKVGPVHLDTVDGPNVFSITQVNGLNALQCTNNTGSRLRTSSTLTIPQPLSFFCVFRFDSRQAATSPEFLLDSLDVTDARLIFFQEAGRWQVTVNGGTHSYWHGPRDGVPHVAMLIKDGSVEQTSEVSGLGTINASPGSNTAFQFISLFSDYRNARHAPNATMCEMLFYDRNLPPEEREQVTDFLRVKWGCDYPITDNGLPEAWYCENGLALGSQTSWPSNPILESSSWNLGQVNGGFSSHAVNGFYGVNSAGTGRLESASSIVRGRGYTEIAVFSPTSLSGTQFITDSRSGSASRSLCFFTFPSSSNWVRNGSSAPAISGTIGTNRRMAWLQHADSGDNRAGFTGLGTVSDATDLSGDDVNYLRLFADWAGNRPFTGRIYEFLRYPRVLADSEVAAIEAFFRTKWSLQD